MRGLISAALGGVSKGVGQVASTQMEVNARKALMEAEEEMRARLAEAAEGRAETRQIAAEERQIANIGRVAEATATAEEGVMTSRFSEGSAYPGLLSRQIEATQTPGQKEQAATFREDREWAAKERDLRSKLAEATSDEDRTRLIEQLSALTTTFGGNERTLGDMVAAGNGYINAANRMFQEADKIEREISDNYELSADQKDEKAKNAEALRLQGQSYISEADRFFRNAGERRMGLDSQDRRPADRPPLSEFLQRSN
jgi:hypothetical protein